MARIAQGQETTIPEKLKHNNIQISYGMVHSRMIDQGYTSSNLLFRGTNSKFNLGYGRETDRYIFNFVIAASFGKLASKGDNLPSDFYLIHPSIEYVRKIAKYRLLKKESHFFAGVHLSSINYALQNSEVIDNIDVFSLHGIYLNFTNRLKLNGKQSLQLTWLIPTMVYSNRVLWKGGASKLNFDDKDHLFRTLTTNGKYSYFDVSGNIQFRADYIFKIGKNADFEIKYRFFYADNFIQTPVHIYSNEVLVGLKFKF
jgi:hypothetical protein